MNDPAPRPRGISLIPEFFKSSRARRARAARKTIFEGKYSPREANTMFKILKNKNPSLLYRRNRLILTVVLMLPFVILTSNSSAKPKFQVEEATIAGIHQAIMTNKITCAGLVQAYIDRAAAYNGVCTKLVTADGAPISPATGTVRAGAPLQFPTETVAASNILPDLDQYVGLPIEFGRMEVTASDPSVQQQFGMRVGIPNAGQLNALETINIRGERSVTCKGVYDAHPSSGPLPAGAPPGCEAFRQQPDALERAAELDSLYGSRPPIDELPMYCIPFSQKNWYDAKDMRSTGGMDVNFAMDVPPVDSSPIAKLRAKGAIIYAIANAADSGLTRPGPATAISVLPSGNYAYGVWGGQPCNPYDTERVPRGTSSGSGVSVSANLVACSICEQGAASCKGPASRNNVVNFLTTKGVMTDGGMNSQRIGDRAGIHCRTVGDAALVLDAIKGFEPRDMFTAIPKAVIPKKPYASFVINDDDLKKHSKPLEGMRIGVVREFMVKHTLNDVAISDQIDNEIKKTLRDKLGAELLESVDPLYPDDPSVANMEYTFQDAFAEILAHTYPEYFYTTTSSGDLEFAVPGWDVRTVDYAVALALGAAPLSENINVRRISGGSLDNVKSLFTMAKYLAERGDTRVYDWASFVANAKWNDDAERAGSQNAAGLQDLRSELEPGTKSFLKMQTVLRLVVLKVMYQNDIDAFVNPENTLPHYKIGGPTEPTVRNRGTASCCSVFTGMLGGPEIEVPAGYNQIVYEPQFVLSSDKTRYQSVTGTVRSLLPVPMPISMMFWAGPGNEPELIKIASAYESATHHRVPPPDFGPL
jgi:amidase